MAVIPISDSILTARDRCISVLDTYLAANLSSKMLANPGYPLPLPEAYITAQTDPEEVWRTHNIGQCAVWVVRDGASRYPQKYAGSPDTYSADQITRFRVLVIFSLTAGYDLPTRNGRQSTKTEWLGDRAEMYRGALIDTLTKNLHHPDLVHGVSLVENASDVYQFEQVGPVGRASVVLELRQEVNILGIF